MLRGFLPRVLALLAAAPAFLLAAPAWSGESDVDGGATSCLGRWVGIGNNGGANWTIDMVVVAANASGCGTIEYPSLGCGGYLERCEPADAGALVVSERYTHNPGTCAPAGSIEMVCYGDEMHWRWIGIAVVTTTLRRVPGSGPPAASGSVPSASVPRPSDGPPPRTREPESGGPPPRAGSGGDEGPAPAPTARPSRESRTGCSCRLVAVHAGDEGGDAGVAVVACRALSARLRARFQGAHRPGRSPT